jgi:hypothetical protein
MADITQPQPQMGLNFEQVWAALMETRAFQQDMTQQIKEAQHETDRQMKETDRRMKELQNRMGELGNRFGELAEHLVIPNIVQKFNALNYQFEDTAKERKFFNPETGCLEAEFDIFLENGAYSIDVEVKTKPADKDVVEHISRLKFLRKYKDKKGDKREIRGAIAGAIMPDNVRKVVLMARLYMIEQSGIR